MNKTTLFLVTLVVLLVSGSAFAQVTIGSIANPNSGALLDLKEETTTTKGLLLPRVKLQAEDKLQMGDTAADLTAQGLEHTGLMVYNTEPVVDNPAKNCPIELLAKGLHVWDGLKWVGMPQKEEQVLVQSGWVGDETTGVGILTDIEGNTYPTKRFHITGASPADVGIWTTVNFYSTRDNQGNLFLDGVRMNHGYATSSKVGFVCTVADLSDEKSNIEYAEGATSSLTPGNVTTMNFLQVFGAGLMYRLEQAKKVCPTGWHLPTTGEWDALINVITDRHESARKNNNFYASRDGVEWKWGVNDAFQGTWSGFDAVPAGFADSSGGEQTFGVTSYFWTSDDYFRGLEYYSEQLQETSATNPHYMSVRCVRD